MVSTVNFHILEFMVSKITTVEGSVRVDLLGGTLDLVPINLILPDVVTLNLATSLKAKVVITPINFDGVEIVSKDYKTTDKFHSQDFTAHNFQNKFFGNLEFIARILNLFGLHKGVRLELESGSPPGAGLGGSSAMGVTCYSAIANHLDIPYDRVDAITKINAIEALIIDCPAGYQDYYPALFGGVLGLKATPGKVDVIQLYSEELREVLENNVTLVYSGETRNSGINNWEVYKAFFNKDAAVRAGLAEISRLSNIALQAIQSKNYESLIPLIGAEGEERRKLFPGIMTPKMNQLYSILKDHGSYFGMKICGAGGGGCFLITHHPSDREYIDQLLVKFEMKRLPFNVEKPI